MEILYTANIAGREFAVLREGKKYYVQGFSYNASDETLENRMFSSFTPAKKHFLKLIEKEIREEPE